MTKTILALATAGIIGAAMVPAAHAITPGATGSQPGMTGMQSQTSVKQQQAQLRRDRILLRRDVRLGKTSEIRKLRREINADERAVHQARGGVQKGTSARSMQPQTPMPPDQNNATQNQNANTPSQKTTNNNQ